MERSAPWEQIAVFNRTSSRAPNKRLEHHAIPQCPTEGEQAGLNIRGRKGRGPPSSRACSERGEKVNHLEERPPVTPRWKSEGDSVGGTTEGASPS
ncbi:hypothetical protein NDU88_008386 [Pleurodeles waltl]|uniref:Uncharacterized protein n=1 Tax=Pleurodeles waltl TaxID=8319 RepID=A0AAV7RVK6_PLEWA|nr:hypothetical protein NDU88_008386 [Pleurodeles waltl]